MHSGVTISQISFGFIRRDFFVLQQTLYNVNRALTLRLEELENKCEILLRTVSQLTNKVRQVEEKA